MAMSREERLLATQQVYEAWSETVDFVTDDNASDEDEAKLLDTMLDQGLINPN
jgi:hypothetical protein